MSVEAWLFMGVFWGVIIANVAYCFYRLLTSQRRIGGDD